MESARKIGSELLLAAIVNGVFFVLVALALWPLGKVGLAGHLSKGLCLFALVICVAAAANALLQKLLRIESDPLSDAYVIVNLAVSAVVQLGWPAFAALAVSSQVSGAPFWMGALLHLVGWIASWLSTAVTSAFFQGSLYKRVNALLALAGYPLFALWPAAGRALYGWFFGWL
jgi:hypothetical protein